MKFVFLDNLHHAYAQTDGSYAFPNSREGDMLKQAKKEIEQLQELYKGACAAEDAIISMSKSQQQKIDNMEKELQFLRSQDARWALETRIINDILDGKYDPWPSTFEYETELSDKIKKMVEEKKL